MKTMKTLKIATAAALLAASTLMAVPASATSNPLLRDCLIQRGCQEFPDGSWLCFDPNAYGDCWAMYGDAG